MPATLRGVWFEMLISGPSSASIDSSPVRRRRNDVAILPTERRLNGSLLAVCQSPVFFSEATSLQSAWPEIAVDSAFGDAGVGLLLLESIEVSTETSSHSLLSSASSITGGEDGIYHKVSLSKRLRASIGVFGRDTAFMGVLFGLVGVEGVWATLVGIVGFLNGRSERSAGLWAPMSPPIEVCCDDMTGDGGFSGLTSGFV